VSELELFQSAQVGDVSLVINASATYDEWLHIGDTLGRIGRAHQWWIGDWLRHGEHKWGEKYDEAIKRTGLEYQTLADQKWVADRIDLSLRNEKLEWSHHREVASLEPAEQARWLDLAEENAWPVRELRRQIRERRELAPPPLPEGRFRSIVIDPPWPMDKIVREQRPKQGAALDYPTMSLGQIAALPIADLAADGCHIYLWVTHRFLPAGLDLFDQWGVTYQCQMTWKKNVGITPFSWMYDTEHVLFGRIGSLDLLQNGLRLSFEAPVQGHSVKPDVFYERVIAASPTPRLEMFARHPREGFTVWGNEAAA
jgi:N6-adenosine-specific RNA methylase IME4